MIYLINFWSIFGSHVTSIFLFRFIFVSVLYSFAFERAIHIDAEIYPLDTKDSDLYYDLFIKVFGGFRLIIFKPLTSLKVDRPGWKRNRNVRNNIIFVHEVPLLLTSIINSLITEKTSHRKRLALMIGQTQSVTLRSIMHAVDIHFVLKAPCLEWNWNLTINSENELTWSFQTQLKAFNVPILVH